MAYKFLIVGYGIYMSLEDGINIFCNANPNLFSYKNPTNHDDSAYQCGGCSTWLPGTLYPLPLLTGPLLILGGSLPLFPFSHVLGVAVHSIPPPCPVQWHLTNVVPTLCLSFCGCTNQGANLPQFWRLAVPNQGVGKVGSFRSSWPRSVSASHPAYGSCWPSLASLGLQLHHSNLGLYCHMVYTLYMSLHPNFPHLLRIQVIGLGLILIILAKALFLTKVIFTGVRTCTCLCRVHTYTHKNLFPIVISPMIIMLPSWASQSPWSEFLFGVLGDGLYFLLERFIFCLRWQPVKPRTLNTWTNWGSVSRERGSRQQDLPWHSGATDGNSESPGVSLTQQVAHNSSGPWSMWNW